MPSLIRIVQNHFVQHLAAAVVAFVVLMIIAPRYAYLFTLTVGQAHFIGAYMYQVRAKKLTLGSLYAYLAVGVALAVLFLLIDNYYLITLVSAAFFTAHHSSDEIKLLGQSFSPVNIVISLSAVVAYMMIVFTIIYPTVFSVQSAMWGIALVLMLFIPLLISGKITSRGTRLLFVYFLATTFTFWCLLYFKVPLSLGYFINAQALFHYGLWYFYQYGRTFHPASRTLPCTYLKEMGIILSVVMAMFLLFVLWESSLPSSALVAYNMLYAPATLYAFTIVHVVSSAVMNLKGTPLRVFVKTS